MLLPAWKTGPFLFLLAGPLDWDTIPYGPAQSGHCFLWSWRGNMSRVCEVCGKKVAFGRKYARRGLPKKVGGIGLKVTGKTLRKFKPNIQNIRVQEPDGTVRSKRVCAKCLRKGMKDGSIVKAPRGAHSAWLKEKAEAEAAQG